jgi:DNA anti-recombination protein RmuC
VDDLARLLVQLDRSIAGGDDRSLLSQAKLLRADNSNHFDRLTETFGRYAENIAETNSKALVSALSEVVRDFNLKINEQFGDNFRQLNSGVERLVSWQVQYENQLEALIRQETATRESMTEAALRFTDIVNTASEFAAVARSLQNIVRALNNQSEQLSRALMLLSGLITEVTEGLPIIEQRIGQLIARSEQGIRPNQETLGAVSRHPAESIQATGA